MYSAVHVSMKLPMKQDLFTVSINYHKHNYLYIFCIFFFVEYPEAKELYTNAIKICPDDFTKEKSVFYANRAACLVKMVCSL